MAQTSMRGRKQWALKEQWRSARVEAVQMQQVEGVVDHSVVASLLQVVLQRGEVRVTLAISRDDFAVNDELARR
jgi:hypothetical protein